MWAHDNYRLLKCGPGSTWKCAMSVTRICLPLHHRMMAAGSILCVAGVVAWPTATAIGQTTLAPALPQQPAPVLVSFSALDMSRLAPAQFGDWDAAAAQPTR